MALPKAVVLKDKDLEAAAASASEELAKLRWHWTLDESNPERESFRAYAKAVGRHHSVIASMVNGYVTYLEDKGVGGAVDTGLNEHIERAKMGVETELATEAVAASKGVSFQNARKKHAADVRHVRERARERAAKKGTTVEKEVPEVVKGMERHDEVQAKRKAKKKAEHFPEWIELSQHLEYAKTRMNWALNVVRNHDEWPDEYKEFIASDVAKLRSAIDMLELAVQGTTSIDWDSDLEALTKG